MKTILALDLGTAGLRFGAAMAPFSMALKTSTRPRGPRAHRSAAFQAFRNAPHGCRCLRHQATRGTAARTCGRLEAPCWRTVWNGIETAWLGVGEIKKHATGKGNAPKNDVIAAMRARGFEPEDDNDADALALLFAYLDKEDSE